MNKTEESTSETLREIDERIGVLRRQYDDVEGTPTEVYSRIVGYYRSLKNWNRGKRQEYSERVTFRPTGRANAADQPRPDAPPTAAADHRFHYFYRAACPNCPPMRAQIETAGIKAVLHDVDTDDGMREAIRFQVLSTPTLVVADDTGAIAKYRSAQELRAAFDTGKEILSDR